MLLSVCPGPPNPTAIAVAEETVIPVSALKPPAPPPPPIPGRPDLPPPAPPPPTIRTSQVSAPLVGVKVRSEVVSGLISVKLVARSSLENGR